MLFTALRTHLVAFLLRLPRAAQLGAFLCLAFTTLVGAEAPPDLLLEWAGPSARGGSGKGGLGAEALRGEEGATVAVEYRLRNVGGSDAFAAVIEARTALGREGRPLRIQPGPKAGASTTRRMNVALAVGMRELCIEVQLQTLNTGGPVDPRPEDNRICRRVEVTRIHEETAPPPGQGLKRRFP